MDASSKLLVIDDETIVRQSVVAYLEDSGFDVHEAENGEQGHEVFRQEAPDLVLCDIRMPRLDGLGVLKHISEENPDTPVIVVSGAGVMTDVVEALRLGASDYLIKPVSDLAVLEHSIRRNLERAELRRENQRYRLELEETNRELKSSLEVLEADHQAGRQAQLRMLPSTPFSFGEYTCNHKILPSLFLSGDFVDYFALTDDKFLFYIADVSGHGASSAFVTVLLKNMMNQMKRAYFSGEDDTITHPAKILSRINQELIQTALGKHLTIFLGIVDTQDESLLYTIGAHFPGSIIATSDSVHYLEGEGLPIGLFEEAEYKENRIKLPPKFTLAMFSDGILEILPQNTLAEKEAFLLKMLSEGRCTIESMADALGLEGVKDAPDDIALVTVARNPE